MLTRSRARSIGWAVILALCFGLTLALTFRVNAVKSQVRLTERKIVALRLEKGLLETEFETRANQQQLRSLNDVEFGYQAPTAGQYLETERDLAMLGKAQGPGAPEMIRVAHNDVAERPSDSVLPAMVNPLTGKALAAELPSNAVRPAKAAKPEKLASAVPAGEAKGNALVERLSHVERKPAAVKLAALKGADKVAAGATAKSAPAKARKLKVAVD
jgi:hypothetical protein